MRCIWCQKERSVWTLEHPIPESLGNSEITLPKGVCRKCNSAFGVLDAALLRPFELLTVSLGIPRKGGRRPTIDGWRGMKSRWVGEQPELFLNAGPDDVVTPIGTLKVASKAAGIQSITTPDHPVPGQRVDIGIRHDLRFGRKFVRGIYKCGFELLLLQIGLDLAQDPAFDRVRSFCLDDEGDLSALVIFREFDRVGVSSYFMEPELPSSAACSFELFGMEFICDFSPGQRYLDRIESEGAEAVGAAAIHRIPYPHLP